MDGETDRILHNERCPGCGELVDMKPVMDHGELLWMCQRCGTGISPANLNQYRKWRSKMAVASAAAKRKRESREKHSA